MGDAEAKDQAPAPGLIPEILADLHIAAPLACACRDSVLCAHDSSDVQSTFSFFASQSLHNRKILKKKSGDVNDEVNFPFFILLHKRAKPMSFTSPDFFFKFFLL